MEYHGDSCDALSEAVYKLMSQNKTTIVSRLYSMVTMYGTVQIDMSRVIMIGSPKQNERGNYCFIITTHVHRVVFSFSTSETCLLAHRAIQEYNKNYVDYIEKTAINLK